jgi:hypothetical protein
MKILNALSGPNCLKSLDHENVVFENTFFALASSLSTKAVYKTKSCSCLKNI